MSDEKVWRGWAWWNVEYKCWQGITHKAVGRHDVEIVILPAADYDAILAHIAELEKKDG